MTDNAGHWVTVAEAARILMRSPRTIRRWGALGKLPVRRDVRPYEVDLAGQVTARGGQRPDVADMTGNLSAELEGLRAEIGRLRERIQELTHERDYLRLLAGSLAQGQQLALEARPRRRWTWPWQRKERSP